MFHHWANVWLTTGWKERGARLGFGETGSRLSETKCHSPSGKKANPSFVIGIKSNNLWGLLLLRLGSRLSSQNVMVKWCFAIKFELKMLRSMIPFLETGIEVLNFHPFFKTGIKTKKWRGLTWWYQDCQGIPHSHLKAKETSFIMYAKTFKEKFLITCYHFI